MPSSKNNNHAGEHPWNSDSGDAGNAEDFDYDAVELRGERGNPQLGFDEPPSAIEIASDGLSELLNWVWQTKDFKTAFVKFVAMSAVMRPELLDDQSYLQLAKKINCTKSLISHNVKTFEAEFGLHFRRSRRAGGCEVMSAARFKAANGPKTRNGGKFLK